MAQNTSIRSCNALLVLVFMTVPSAIVFADEDDPLTKAEAASNPAPGPEDKSAYGLSNPVPAVEMRSFCTDRPTKSSAPCTVDAGHFQYETDLFNWTYNRNAGVTQNTYLYANPTLKMGLTSRLDVELNIAPVEEVTTHDKAAQTHSDLTGIGDLFLRAKFNFFGNDGNRKVALSVYPYVKLPTAPPGIGNKAVEEGVIVPVSFTLPKSFSLLFDPEVDMFKNADGGNYHANYQGLVNISHSLGHNLTGAVEFWADDNRDPSGTLAQASLDTAVTWTPRPNLQFDIGADIGLTRATPDFQSYVGISQRF